MRRELLHGAKALVPRTTASMLVWSVPQALPSAASGAVLARAVDDGFLAGRPWTGAAWLAALLVAAALAAVASRMVYARIGELVEPYRDGLARHVVGASLHAAVAGRSDSGAVARLTRQVEIVRDAYAGLIVAVRGFAVTSVGVIAGLLALSPRLAAIVLPPFLLGLAAFIAVLGIVAARHRASLEADERLADRAGTVLAGAADLAACGTETHGEAMTAAPIADQARAERAMAHASALRAVCFAIGGWGPMIALLAAGPWLVAQGLSAGTLTGAILYVLFGLQPALGAFVSGVGRSGLRYVVTLGRILDAGEPPRPSTPALAAPRPIPSPELEARALTFAYGPHSAPVVENLDLLIKPGDHLAIIGPSGIGKSTLAGLLCGLLRPDSGSVAIGGAEAASLRPDEAARLRVLIPQEAYVFAGTVRDNLAYLDPEARPGRISAAVDAVGAAALVERLGGLEAVVEPSKLSAGERQLLALVRAHLSPAPICVLDEATCHLDPAAERVAEAAFAEREGTLVVIAHRPGSARRARSVLVLDEGGIAALHSALGP